MHSASDTSVPNSGELLKGTTALSSQPHRNGADCMSSISRQHTCKPSRTARNIYHFRFFFFFDRAVPGYPPQYEEIEEMYNADCKHFGSAPLQTAKGLSLYCGERRSSCIRPDRPFVSLARLSPSHLLLVEVCAGVVSLLLLPALLPSTLHPSPAGQLSGHLHSSPPIVLARLSRKTAAKDQ